MFIYIYVLHNAYSYVPFVRLYGDYESLASCRCVDALVAVSGGVSQRFRLSELDVAWDFNRQCVFKELREALLDSAMITCSIDKQERQVNVKLLVKIYCYLCISNIRE